MTAWHGLAPLWTGAILTLAVGVGVARLWLWNRSAPIETRATPRRLVVLGGLQVLAGAVLFLTLHPPVVALRDTTLVVATRNASTPKLSRGDTLVALPEAGAVQGAERVPDLATALRHHPEAAHLRIVGEGLPPRDRARLTLPVDRTAPPPLVGLVEIALPSPVAPGAAFTVGGRVGALRAGTVELADPAGTVVARAPVVAGGRFTLKGAARAEGQAVFDLRLRDTGGRLVERVDAPVHARADPPARVIALAGAPGPDLNLLRRWAQDAQVDLAVGIDLGAGVRLGQAPARLSAADLAKTDLLIIDERSWERLDVPARSLVAQAVDGGMGLLLRPTSTLSAGTRREWTVLGAPIDGDGAVQPLALPDVDGVPDLARWRLSQSGPDAVTQVWAPDGASLASWRARGQGRIGIWTVRDSYMLALGGRSDAHADLWSRIFSALSRPIPADRPRLLGFARVGERAVICGLTPRDRARPSQGAATPLLIDRRSGPENCAAFWPPQPGWVMIGAPGGPETPLYVHPADAAPSLRAQDAASLMQSPVAARAIGTNASWASRPFWIFLLLMITFAGLWFIERRRPRTP